MNRERGGSFHSNVTLLELIQIHSYVRVRFSLEGIYCDRGTRPVARIFFLGGGGGA